MADQEHLAILKKGAAEWARWREQTDETPDLSDADLSGSRLRAADLSGANLRGAKLSLCDLRDANLRDVNLEEANLMLSALDAADLRGANLTRARFHGAGLIGANLTGANLTQAHFFTTSADGANFSLADLTRADLGDSSFAGAQLAGATLSKAVVGTANLSGADLSSADLSEAVFVGTNLSKAILSGARVYGASAWDVKMEDAQQSNLVITPRYQPEIAVDNLEVAQFIYLLLNNKNIRSIIDTVTAKVVLILGRFTDERKPVLDALRAALRERGYSPVLFDFEGPRARTLTETIHTLAGMARFVIADITDAASIPQELQAIVPHYPTLPVQPVLLASQHQYGMFESFQAYDWVLPVVLYKSQTQLLAKLDAKLIAPAETLARARRPVAENRVRR